MTFRQADIRGYSGQYAARKSTETAKTENKPTAFLSHSHNDANLAKGVQGFLQAQGWEVYIDWEDTSMPPLPSRKTAEQVQAKIRDLDMFLYLATANSSSSRWCPWETGYANGKKKHQSILIIQTRDDYGNEYGAEFLQLYNHLDFAQSGGIGSFGDDNRGYLLQGTMRA